MPRNLTIFWDDDSGGNAEHVAEHGLTLEEVDSVQRGEESEMGWSDQSGLPLMQGGPILDAGLW